MPFYGRQIDLLFCISVINRDVIARQNYNFSVNQQIFDVKKDKI